MEAARKHDPELNAVEVAGALRLATRQLARRLRQNAPSGLSPTLAATLATIAREGPMTLGALATSEGVTAASITRVAVKLVDAGLIVRRVDDADRRVAWVECTTKGRRQLEVTRDRHTAWLASRLEGCTPDELACLHEAAALVTRLVDNESRPQ